jgi:hypothetical protein
MATIGGIRAARMMVGNEAEEEEIAVDQPSLPLPSQLNLLERPALKKTYQTSFP